MVSDKATLQMSHMLRVRHLACNRYGKNSHAGGASAAVCKVGAGGLGRVGAACLTMLYSEE